MHVHVSKHAVILRARFYRIARTNSARRFLRAHMCQTCLLLDAKASEMLVGIQVDVSNHPAIFKGANSLHHIITRTHTRIHTHGSGLSIHVYFLHVRLSGCLYVRLSGCL